MKYSCTIIYTINFYNIFIENKYRLYIHQKKLHTTMYDTKKARSNNSGLFFFGKTENIPRKFRDFSSSRKKETANLIRREEYHTYTHTIPPTLSRIKFTIQSSVPVYTTINMNTTVGLRWRNDCFQDPDAIATFTFASAKNVHPRGNFLLQSVRLRNMDH